MWKMKGSAAGFLQTIKRRRKAILHGLLAISILAVGVTNVWLATCGFDSCPTPREIQQFKPDEGGKILDRNSALMGRLETVRRLNICLQQVPVFVRDRKSVVQGQRIRRGCT